MVKLILALGFLLFAGAAWAQFNGCPTGFCPSIFGGNSSGGSVSCASGSNMTGVFDLTNTCNDIYLLTGNI